MTIEAALKRGAEKIVLREAKILLAHATGYSTNGLYFSILKEISPPEYLTFMSYVERRTHGEPLQYIVGEWDFMGLTFLTDKRALIPRPETELLVEEVYYFITNCEKKPLRVLDVCTGSGCIAVSLARLAGESVKITAVDICPEALSLAKENAKKLGIPEERIAFIESDLLSNVTGEFDVIVSNPPYVLSGEIPTLSPTVRNYEPHLALDGGADGLDLYRRLIPQCKNALCSGGALFLEIGPIEVKGLMEEAGFENVGLIRDYAEIERILKGERG
ncbi:MAG: peptide chain release factor N(5)-glutamine methyltransferase [Defluviitaleaceae bacterium]|nr:peptide chain release factor N(5)-glutamine methyltransferase [Defluviitaleaceae bacterium]